MKKNTLRVVTLAFTSALLVGCASLMPKPQLVEVPLPIPCNIVPPKKPVMPFSDVAVVDDTVGSDIFSDVKQMLAEIQLRIGYETELEAAVKSCNSK